jgi:hypothetical protein
MNLPTLTEFQPYLALISAVLSVATLGFIISLVKMWGDVTKARHDIQDERIKLAQDLVQVLKNEKEGLTLKLAEATEFRTTWSVASLDVRQLNSAEEFSSAATALFEQIRDNTASDYAIIDLGTGQQWLTSRLFIFSII